MRKVIFSTIAAAAAFTSTAAFAADTADVQINAELTQSCTVVSSSPSLTLTNDKAPVVGNFSYSCNFIGSPNLTFTSAKKGVETTENGGARADYAVYLNDAAPTSSPSTWLQASNTPQSYPGITTSNAPNTTVTPSFQVALLDTLEVAGTYSDTLTIDVTP